MTDPIVGGLVTSGLAKGVKSTARRLKEMRLEGDLSPEIDSTATIFYKILRDELIDQAEIDDDIDKSQIKSDWDQIAEDINLSGDIYFEHEEEAVRRITDAIEQILDIDPATNPDTDRRLQQAVATAYNQAIEEFHNQIANSQKASELEMRSADDFRDRIRSVQTNLNDLVERLKSREYYMLFNGTNEGLQQAAEFLTADRPDIPYVDRDNIPELPPAHRTLVVGKHGTGKTRTVAEWLKNTDTPDQVIIPREAFTHTDDLDALLKEDLEGSVALVWDDIHGVDPSTSNRIVRETVLKLDDQLNGDANQLIVLFAADSDRLDDLPGDLDDPAGFWNAFKMFEINEVDPVEYLDFIPALEGYYDTNAEEAMESGRFGEAILDSTPLGLIHALDESVDEVEAAMPSQRQRWQYSYERLQRESPNKRSILDAVRILHDIRVAPTVELVEGFYECVFDHDSINERIGPHLEKLEESGWLKRRNVEDWNGPGSLFPGSDTKVIDIRTAQLRAIPNIAQSAQSELTEFFVEHLPEYLSSDSTRRIDIDKHWLWTAELDTPTAVRIRWIEWVAGGPPPKHIGSDGSTLPLKYREWQDINAAESIQNGGAPYDQAIASYFTEWDGLDEVSNLDDLFEAVIERTERPAIVRTLYARYLMAQQRVEQARQQLSKARELSTSTPMITHGYLSVIELYNEDFQSAADHIAQFIGELGIFFRYEADDETWSAEFALVIESGRMLTRNQRWEAGADKFEYVDEHAQHQELLGPNDYVDWGIALRESGDVDGALDKFETALDHDSRNERAHYQLGLTARKQGKYETAVQHYENFVDCDPDRNVDAYPELSKAYLDVDDPDSASDAIERALDRFPEEPDLWAEQARVEAHKQNATAAADAYERALDLGDDPEDIKKEYIDLLLTGLGPDGGAEVDDEPGEYRLYPADQFKRARPHLEQMYTDQRGKIIDTDHPSATDIEDFSITAQNLILCDSLVEDVTAARNRVIDAVEALPHVPARGEIILSHFENITAENDVWLRVSVAFNLFVNWEYESAAALLAPLWEIREKYDQEGMFWSDLVVGITLYGVCVDCGYAPDVAETDSETIARWVRSVGAASSLFELPIDYILDDNLREEPCRLYYSADRPSEDVELVPTGDELYDRDQHELELIVTGRALRFLVEENNPTPFDADVDEAVSRRPDPDENPQLVTVDGVGPSLGIRLRKAGVQTHTDLTYLDRDDLLKIKGIGESTAEDILNDLPD